MTPPLISVIVPTRNRAALLARLLESLSTLRYPSWEAIVVDDGSTDDTPMVAEGFRVRGLPITYLYQPWAKMGSARNRAVSRARGEIVAFTDDDCLVDPGWLEAIAAAFDAHPDALGVQGRTVTIRTEMTPFTRQVEQLEGGQPYRTCNIAYRTGIVRDLGGFDPHLIRGEDVVMGMRVLERGPIVFAPDAVVVHPPRPKEWANRAAWRTLLESELHFKRTYPRYAPARSQTLSLQKADHVLSRWVLLPVRRYWRWHYAYLKRNPREYLRHVPRIVGEKAALFSLFPYFLHQWYRSVRGLHGTSTEADAVVAPVPLPREDGEPGENASPFATVIVPTRNRAHFLPALLTALAAQDYPRFEVIVVDDASGDDTASILTRWEGEGRRVIRLEQPSGSYTARNHGWQAAGGEIIAFTDDDCLPDPGWLSGLVGSMRDPAVPGAQGITLAGPGEITPFTHQIEQTRPGAPYRTCNIAYRRSALERVGGFEGQLRWYADNILGLRTLAALDAIAFSPDAAVRHPPRPKEWRSRATWLARFRADAVYRRHLLALGNRSRIAPPRTLPIILWILRPLAKQSRAHITYFLRHPGRYLRQAPPMAGEKWAMLLAMWDYWREERAESRPVEEALPPLSANPLVSVLIVTRGRPQLLEDALTALARQTWRNHEVIVVETSGRAWAREVAKRFGVRWIPSQRRALAAARQAAVDAAGGEIVAFTDDDCLPDPRWLEQAVASFRQEPELWGVQGRTVAERGPIGAHAVRVAHPDPLYQTCNIAYRHDALERAQGFDVGFRGWFEDTALGARVRAHGAIGWNPAMLVTHRAMPRRVLGRGDWYRLLADERRLAREYSRFYRRTRGPGFLPTVVARWLIGSPLKAMLRDLPAAARDPAAYVAFVRSLLHERSELFRALVTILRPPAD